MGLAIGMEEATNGPYGKDQEGHSMVAKGEDGGKLGSLWGPRGASWNLINNMKA